MIGRGGLLSKARIMLNNIGLSSISGFENRHRGLLGRGADHCKFIIESTFDLGRVVGYIEESGVGFISSGSVTLGEPGQRFGLITGRQPGEGWGSDRSP